MTALSNISIILYVTNSKSVGERLGIFLRPVVIYPKAEAGEELMNGEEFIEAADVFEKLRETHI